MSIEQSLEKIAKILDLILAEMKKDSSGFVERSSSDELDGSSDILIDEAAEIIINSGKASTSYLQRRLSIGYGRAARLIDLLEDAKVIGPAKGATPREVLMTKKKFESILKNGKSVFKDEK
jgi:S-DNA-T family DNA segregation ATPase FtsK/SpoIIIE